MRVSEVGTGAAMSAEWAFCPRCGRANSNSRAAGGNDACWHCGACGYVQCADDAGDWHFRKAVQDAAEAGLDNERLRAALRNVWALCTDTRDEVVERFGDSRLNDDHARLNYMAELIAEFVEDDEP